jgi:hypothetical protein
MTKKTAPVAIMEPIIESFYERSINRVQSAKIYGSWSITILLALTIFFIFHQRKSIAQTAIKIFNSLKPGNDAPQNSCEKCDNEKQEPTQKFRLNGPIGVQFELEPIDGVNPLKANIQLAASNILTPPISPKPKKQEKSEEGKVEKSE